MALALYRKYRPRTFAEVIGQEHVTEPLSAALSSGRLHHAYLFSGPRGCGKTSSARILARSLNCVKGPTPTPCGECDSCVALAPDGSGSIDVIEIDAASHGGVDDARDLRERAFYAPVSSRFKVYVIDEAHMVTAQGFNALLKLVEEPPEHVIFVFATTEPEKVLGTIKSRTHHYPFRLIPPGVLRPYLEELCQAEGVAVEPPVFPLVVRAGGGSARDSLSVLDQLISGAGPEGVSYARAVALLGVTDVALIDEMCDALAANDGAAVYSVIDRVAEAGHDPRRFASDLLERLRDLIVLRQVPEAVAKGLLDAPADQLERMAAQAERMGPATLSRCADLVHNGLTEMRGTTAPRLLLELVCARMLLPGADDAHSAVLQRLERLERRLGASSDAVPTDTATVPPAYAPPRPQADAGPQGAVAEAMVATTPSAETTRQTEALPPVATAPPAKPARQAEVRPAVAIAPPGEPGPPAAAHSPGAIGSPGAAVSHGSPGVADATAATGSLDAAAIRRVWDEILTYVGRSSKKIAALARDAVVRDVEGSTVVLTLKHAPLAAMLTSDEGVLTQAMTQVVGGTWRIRCEVSGQASAQSSQALPAPAPRTIAARPGGDDDDWPALARPGGAAVATVPPPAVPDPRPSSVSTPTTKRAAAKPPARKASSGRQATPPSGSAFADASPLDEPPFDPDYDSPGRGGVIIGFDPGDEPVDAEPDAVRQTSEEQALQLLAAELGAERIGETEHGR